MPPRVAQQVIRFRWTITFSRGWCTFWLNSKLKKLKYPLKSIFCFFTLSFILLYALCSWVKWQWVSVTSSAFSLFHRLVFRSVQSFKGSLHWILSLRTCQCFTSVSPNYCTLSVPSQGCCRRATSGTNEYSTSGIKNIVPWLFSDFHYSFNHNSPACCIFLFFV